ncbi:MAG: hypothetical protein SOR38_10265, partial [Oscillospiraceae bacterium]|nr:hypothetical protein [Oscillospiraceae bacterium]MDY3066166.1 hypothetical protein [Oscillospiraceae bacterium]
MENNLFRCVFAYCHYNKKRVGLQESIQFSTSILSLYYNVTLFDLSLLAKISFLLSFLFFQKGGGQSFFVNVGLSNILDSELCWRKPTKRSHRKVVGTTIVDRKLLSEVLKRIEGVT